MEKEKLTFKESVTLFLSRTIIDFQNEEEIPAMNVVFPPSAFKLFEYIKNNPFTKENYYVPPLYDYEIARVKLENQNKPHRPTIIVKEPIKFFEYLTDITNSLIDQQNKYWGGSSPRSTFIRDIKRIFLRMSPSDLTNIEAFLSLQLSFLKSNDLDEYIKKNTCIGEFQGYKLYTSKEENATWCETSDKMTFYLSDDNGTFHTLPSIHFGISEESGEKICYIYGIQNERLRKVDKKISRLLYKLNSGIENCTVHPSSILSLKIFIEILNNHNITKIKVPALQVLSYRYHEILSMNAEKEFHKKFNQYTFESLKYMSKIDKENFLREYEEQKEWYDRVVNKQDFISQTKTEGLYNIFYRLEEQFETISIKNVPFIEDEYMHIEIINDKKYTKCKS